MKKFTDIIKESCKNTEFVDCKKKVVTGRTYQRANKIKNECGKTRKVDNPYEIWTSGDWEWRVLKKYQSPEKEKTNPYARWFCAVKSPFTYDGYDYGDVYVKDIVRNAVMVKGKADLSKVMREEVDSLNIF